MSTIRNWSVVMMLAVVLFSAISITSCSKDDDSVPPTLIVSASTLDFTALGGEKSFFVTSNTSWTINGARSWCFVSVTQGNGNNEVIVEVEKNTTKETRTCRLTISTSDGLNQTVSITQDAAETTLIVSPADITLSGESGAKDEITITSNGHWTISNIPDWLNIPSSGDGDTKCKLETLFANDNDEDRIAELHISAEGKNAVLKVTQKALRVKCYIEPKNLVALYDEIGFELLSTGDVHKYKCIIYSGDDIDNNRVTDKEIEEVLKQEEEMTLADSDPIFFPDWFYSDGYGYYMQSDSKYYICTISYDSNGNSGVLKKTPIRTLKAVDSDYDAYVSINATIYYDAIEFECKKEAYCDTYHLIYGNMPSTNFTRALFAFEINYYLKNHKKHWYAEQRGLEIETYYPNTHTFTHYYKKSLAEWPLVIIAGWGVFKDGTVSSDLRYASLDTSVEAQKYMIQQQPIRKKSDVKQKYDRQNSEVRAIYRSDVK